MASRVAIAERRAASRQSAPLLAYRIAPTADAVLAAGGEVTGVIPHFMVEQGWQHKGLTEMIEVENMHQRKQKMADLSALFRLYLTVPVQVR